MEKIKLLVIIKDFKNYLHKEPLYLLDELSFITELAVWNDPGDINEIVKRINFNPDFILIYLYKSQELYSPPIFGLNSLEIPFGVYIEDLHNLQDFSESVKVDNVKHIFTCYRDAFYKMYPEFTEKVKWLPHHVNTKIFKDYGLSKETDMLMMGAVAKEIYPFRHKILRRFMKHSNFTYHSHPGYTEIDNEKNIFVEEQYAREINKAKIFFTCDSKLHYPILKYFEVPACKTLLLAPHSKELFDLGFRDGENFVAINKKDFYKKALYYLRNEEERQRIAENGYIHIHEKHSTLKRARELVLQITEILEN